ncbi:MAG TPA: hypothetical protein DDW52_15430 [Planctomycetaceae bacterium]|nr:hypothetical protein [Planctomycetaceae bacterium]
MTRNRGFTILELIVVVTIIILLLAILVPALQMARESSRRVSCTSNLKQLGLGLLNYEASHRSFPYGQSEGGGFLVALLPFVEQEALGRQVSEFQRLNQDYARFSFHNWLFLCPSDPGPPMIGEGSMTGSNYCGNSGASVLISGRFDGLFRPSVDSGFGCGSVSPSHITNGLAQTSAMSELLRANGDLDRMRVVWNTPKSFPDDHIAFARFCESLPQQPAQAGFVGDPFCKGTPWIDGNLTVTLYNHLCTPNKPSCFNGVMVPSAATTPSSMHKGIVNMSYVDGHVTSVDESIDRKVWIEAGMCSKHRGL